MPDSQNRQNRDLSQYDAMDEGQLRQILRDDASKPEGEESDMEMLLYVMEVLAKRRKERNEAKDPEAALESFKKYYDENDTDSSISENVPVAGKRYISKWRRSLFVVAAMLALVIGCSITASALGFDVWEIVAKWTQETFHFGYTAVQPEDNAPGKDEDFPYNKLQAALQEFHITQKLVPTWIPDGYEAVDVRTVETPLQRQFIAKYQCDDKVIKIWIADYLDAFPDQIEQSDSASEIYESNGIQYYIFSDIGSLQAVWVNENFECYISGPLTVEEIEKMIDSIEKG